MSASRDSNVFTGRKLWWLLEASERRRAIGLLLMMITGMALETLGVGLVIPAVGILTQTEYLQYFPWLQPVLRFFGNPSHEVLVAAGMLALVGVYVIKGSFLAVLSWSQAKFAYNVQAELSQRLFALYLRQPYVFHLQRNSAQLIRNAVNEVQQLTANAIIPGMQLVTESLVVLGLAVLLLAIEPAGALIVVVVIGGTSWLFHRSTRHHIQRWGKERLHHDGLRFQHLQQGLGGVKEVKLLGRETEFLEQYGRHNILSARAGRLQRTIQQLPRLWLEVLAVVGLAALVLIMLAQGRDIGVILPTLAVFAAAAFRLMPTVNRLISSVQSLRYGLSVIDTLYEEFQLETPKPNDGDQHRSGFTGLLEIRRVKFTYAGAPAPAIQDLSLKIRRGEAIGFIGPSGAGKSTLVDILLGLLAPDSGALMLDGANVRDALRSWQEQIGYVPQSIFLTDDSLRRNVAFGLANDRIDETAVWRALELAQLDEFVRALPDALDTIVGERGVRLSGGQRQRIGIARALYHDPAVLVLDEATSSLDTRTEKDVMQAVRALKGNKTIVIVAHRYSTVEYCDRIYRLECGKVVEEGKPGEMLTQQLRSGSGMK